MTTKNIVSLGLANTGKTTFVAALWAVVEGGEVAQSLQAAKLGNDIAHLNKIRDAWLSCRPFDRTVRDRDAKVTLHLVNPAEPSEQIQLSIPDPTGEVIHEYFKIREWPVQFEREVSEADGLLVFIHPGHLQESHYLAPIIAVATELEEVTGSSEIEVDGAASGPEEPWSEDLVDTDAVMVDLLQQFQRAQRGRPKPVGVSVVISAWDLVGSAIPAQWIARQLPLFHQFLTSQPELFRTKFFGVSAQGGELSDRDRLLSFRRPAERINIVGESVLQHDITAPIKWLLLN